jgi:hypothetical protein
MTLRMRSSSLARNDKFVSEIQISVRKTCSHTTPENTVHAVTQGKAVFTKQDPVLWTACTNWLYSSGMFANQPLRYKKD